jgi:acetyltransferase-like isoleucine patch superfamily enzyme
MTLTKKNDDRSNVTIITHMRRDVLQFQPRQIYLSILHVLAMYCPIHKLRIVFYKMRGTKIERNVFLADQVYLEEGHPELITIKENSDLGPRVIILTHDTVLGHLDPTIQSSTSEVTIGRDCYIGAGTIILPGMTIGDNSIIGAGSVVTRSIPPGSVAMGVPAKVVCSREEWGRKHLVSK